MLLAARINTFKYAGGWREIFQPYKNLLWIPSGNDQHLRVPKPASAVSYLPARGFCRSGHLQFQVEFETCYWNRFPSQSELPCRCLAGNTTRGMTLGAQEMERLTLRKRQNHRYFFDPDMLFYNHGVGCNELICGTLFKVKDAKEKTLLNRSGELAGPDWLRSPEPLLWTVPVSLSCPTRNSIPYHQHR